MCSANNSPDTRREKAGARTGDQAGNEAAAPIAAAGPEQQGGEKASGRGEPGDLIGPGAFAEQARSDRRRVEVASDGAGRRSSTREARILGGVPSGP